MAQAHARPLQARPVHALEVPGPAVTGGKRAELIASGALQLTSRSLPPYMGERRGRRLSDAASSSASAASATYCGHVWRARLAHVRMLLGPPGQQRQADGGSGGGHGGGGVEARCRANQMP